MPLGRKLPLLIGLLCCVASAEETSRAPTKEELQQLRELEEKAEKEADLQKALDNLQAKVEAVSKLFYYDCMLSFGHSGFCECVRDNRPAVVDFPLYVRITGHMRHAQDKAVVDTTLKARDTCVRKLGFK